MATVDFPTINGDFPWLCKRLPDAKLAGKTPMTMSYDTGHYSIHMVYKTIYNCRGAHIVIDGQTIDSWMIHESLMIQSMDIN